MKMEVYVVQKVIGDGDGNPTPYGVDIFSSKINALNYIKAENPDNLPIFYENLDKAWDCDYGIFVGYLLLKKEVS